MSRAHLMRKLRRYKRLYDNPPPAELDWCTPYLKQMSDLMGELEIRAPR